MNICAQVLLMGACILAANALPKLPSQIISNVIDAQDLMAYEVILANVRASLINLHPLTAAEQACADRYSNATQSYINNLAKKTNRCNEKANKTMNANNNNINAAAKNVRNNTVVLQRQLTTCLNMTDNQKLIACTLNNFDSNLMLLNSANNNAYDAQPSINTTQVEAVRQSCVNHAFGEAQVSMTMLTNDYKTCLTMAHNQKQISDAVMVADEA